MPTEVVQLSVMCMVRTFSYISRKECKQAGYEVKMVYQAATLEDAER